MATKAPLCYSLAMDFDNSNTGRMIDPGNRIGRYHHVARACKKRARVLTNEALLAGAHERYNRLEDELSNLYWDLNANLFFDRLYGSLVLPEWVWRVLHTREMLEMRGRGQSSIPHVWAGTSTVCSTWEHAIGTAYLATLVQSKPEFADVCSHLVADALVHDLGGAAIRHISDPLMRLVLGITHEERLGSKLKRSETGEVLAMLGFDLDRIIAECNGQGLAGELLASKHGVIDVDSADNVFRFNESQGLLRRPQTAGGIPRLQSPVTELAYSPERLVLGYTLLPDGRLAYRASAVPQVKRYYNQRQLLYEHVGYEMHLARETMMTRALLLAYKAGQLNEAFFDLTDEEARQFLRGCTPACQDLIERLDQGRLYRRAYLELASDDHWNDYSERAVLVPDTDRLQSSRLNEARLRDPLAWDEFAEAVADYLKLPPHEVAVQVRLRDKGYREMRLPVLHANGRVEEPAPGLKYPLRNPYVVRRAYSVYVFASRRVRQPYETYFGSPYERDEEFETIWRMVFDMFGLPPEEDLKYRGQL